VIKHALATVQMRTIMTSKFRRVDEFFLNLIPQTENETENETETKTEKKKITVVTGANNMILQVIMTLRHTLTHNM